MAGIPELTDCNPGLRATGFAVIVAVAPPEKQTKSGLHLPDSVVEKDKLTGVQGRIVSVSPAAFDFAEFGGAEPKVGNVVQFARLAGIMVDGADGNSYRVLNDRDVLAVVEGA